MNKRGVRIRVVGTPHLGYGSTYYPQTPIELVSDSTLALETSLATLDLKNNERLFMATLEDNTTESHPRFESRDFVLAHSFRKSGDKGIVSGLNSANSGATNFSS